MMVTWLYLQRDPLFLAWSTSFGGQRLADEMFPGSSARKSMSTCRRNVGRNVLMSRNVAYCCRKGRCGKTGTDFRWRSASRAPHRRYQNISKPEGLLRLRHPPQSERDRSSGTCPSAYATCRSPGRKPCDRRFRMRQLQLSCRIVEQDAPCRGQSVRTRWHAGHSWFLASKVIVARKSVERVSGWSAPSTIITAKWLGGIDVKHIFEGKRSHQLALKDVCHVASSATMPFGSSFMPGRGRTIWGQLAHRRGHWPCRSRAGGV